MKTPLRILIPSLVFGRSGGFRVLSRLGSEWCRMGHEVTFMVPATGGEPYFPTDAKIIRVDSAGIVPAAAPVSSARHSGPLAAFSLYKGLAQVGRDFDVILLNHSFTVLPGVMAPTGDARLFYYIQAYEPDYYAGQPLNWLAAKLTYYLKTIRIVNAPIYQHYKGIRARYVVPPGIDLDNFHVKPALADWGPDSEVTIGCIGRSEPDKGIRFALEAFEKLAALDPRYRMRVAYGNLPNGWSHPNLEIIVPANDGELADFYRSLDVLIAPGTVQHGAVHYPVLEAMSCGTPVVTTGYSPADETNAWLVENRSSDSIVRAVHALVANPQEALTRVHRGLESVKRYSWSNVALEMATLLELAQ
jgi:glycosyltransferase involved in cell wall biosynthesis